MRSAIHLCGTPCSMAGSRGSVRTSLRPVFRPFNTAILTALRLDATRLSRHLLTHVPRQPLRSDLRSRHEHHIRPRLQAGRHRLRPCRPAFRLQESFGHAPGGLRQSLRDRRSPPYAIHELPMDKRRHEIFDRRRLPWHPTIPATRLSRPLRRKGQGPRQPLRSDLWAVYAHGVPNVRSSPRVHGPGVGRPPRLSPGRFGLHGGPVRDARRLRRARHLRTVGARPVPPPEPSPFGGAATVAAPACRCRPFRTPLWTPHAHLSGTPCSMAVSRQQPKSRETSIQHGYPSHALRATAFGLSIRHTGTDATPPSRHLRKKRPGAAPAAPLRPSDSPLAP